MIEVYTDGATRPTNPGHSACAAVVYRDGELIGVHSSYLGPGVTNNQAEYCGMMLGLWAAIELADSRDGENVVIKSDSKLVVNQLNGTWAQNSSLLRGLWTDARNLLTTLDGLALVEVVHVKGHAGIVGNEAADEAAERAVIHMTPVEGWLVAAIDKSIAVTTRVQGYEELATVLINRLTAVGKPTFQMPRVTDRRQRSFLRDANDVGAQALLAAPELVTVLPDVGTTLIGITTKYLVRNGVATRVIPAEVWKALRRWEAFGCEIIVVHKPFGSSKWRTNRDMGWGDEETPVLLSWAFISEITALEITDRPIGWSQTLSLDAEWKTLDELLEV